MVAEHSLCSCRIELSQRDVELCVVEGSAFLGIVAIVVAREATTRPMMLVAARRMVLATIIPEICRMGSHHVSHCSREVKLQLNELNECPQCARKTVDPVEVRFADAIAAPETGNAGKRQFLDCFRD
jgi:hypothetical protein